MIPAEMEVQRHVEAAPVLLRLPAALQPSDERFAEICRLNRDLVIERTAEGDLVLMTPTGGKTGARSSEINFQLRRWAKADGSGVAFDSSTGFVLPNGAVRSPDASWVRRSRLAALSERERERFLPLCPDFAVELCSPSDDFALLRAKMAEYAGNGAALGWLIIPNESLVEVYRPGLQRELLRAPAVVSADPELPGFTLQMAEVWEIRW